MKTAALLSMLLFCITVQARMLPPDGCRITVYELDAVIPDNTGELCDLSGATVIAETEMRFEYYGDSLVRRVAGPRADWLRVSDDSIWSIGADTRRDNIRYTAGLPYLLPARDAECADSMRYRMFMTVDRDNLITSSYRSYRDCGFVLPDGDSIASTYCVLTETYDTLATVSHRRWYADGAVWPVVEYVTVKIDDDVYSTLDVCPLSNQPRSPMAAKGKTSKERPDAYSMLAMTHSDDRTPYSPGPQADILPHSIALTADGITVSGDDDDASVRLFDTAGRQWYRGKLPATIPVSHIPPGAYLLHITSPAGDYTTKIILGASL